MPIPLNQVAYRRRRYQWHQSQVRLESDSVAFNLPPLILSAALAKATVLAIVAASVGGSLAAKKGHCNAGTLAQSTSFSVPQAFHNSSCPTANSTSQVTSATASTLSTSDCERLGKIYVSKIGTHTEFDVFCNSDLGGADLIGLWHLRLIFRGLR